MNHVFGTALDRKNSGGCPWFPCENKDCCDEVVASLQSDITLQRLPAEVMVNVQQWLVFYAKTAAKFADSNVIYAGTMASHWPSVRVTRRTQRKTKRQLPGRFTAPTRATPPLPEPCGALAEPRRGAQASTDALWADAAGYRKTSGSSTHTTKPLGNRQTNKQASKLAQI